MKPPVCRAGEAGARPGPEITGNVITMITPQPSSQPTILTLTLVSWDDQRCLVSWSKLTWQYVESCLCALLYNVVLCNNMTIVTAECSHQPPADPGLWVDHPFPILLSRPSAAARAAECISISVNKGVTIKCEDVNNVRMLTDVTLFRPHEVVHLQPQWILSVKCQSVSVCAKFLHKDPINSHQDFEIKN